MLLKICGMRDEANIRAVLKTIPYAVKPAMLGFIFYERSPRFAEKYGYAVSPDVVRSLRKSVQTIGVFVNAKRETILETVQRYDLCGVQLHGAETPSFCRDLGEELAMLSGKMLSGNTPNNKILLLKAFSIALESDFEDIPSYEGAVDYGLLDAKGLQYGGNGTTFDWSLLQKYEANIPFFLSGGIGNENVEDIKNLRHSQLIGVDVNSRFETAPALKNPAKLAEFALALNAA